jgi:hypothetical protein
MCGTIDLGHTIVEILVLAEKIRYDKFALLSLRQEVVGRVLQLILVVMAPRSDGLLGDVCHNITDRCFEGWPLVLAEDPGLREDLCNYLEFYPPWMWDSLDPISCGGGDAQVSL